MVRLRKYTITNKKEIVLHIYCDSETQAIALGVLLTRRIEPEIEKLAKEIKA